MNLLERCITVTRFKLYTNIQQPTDTNYNIKTLQYYNFYLQTTV